MSDTALKSSSAKHPLGRLFMDMARESWGRGAAFAGDLSFRTLPQGFGASLPTLERFLAYPKDLSPSDADKAEQIMSGLYVFPGGRVQTTASQLPWTLVPPNEAWAEALHGFAWLADFEAVNDEMAKAHVRRLVTTWIAECGHWHPIAWQPHILGRRLISWFRHGRLITHDTDLTKRSALMHNMARQVRHLTRSASWAKEGEAKLTAAIGLTLSALCLPGGKRQWQKGIVLLRHELNKQILPDGGHVSRNPSAHLTILLDLMTLQDGFTERDRPVPIFLSDIISRMAPMVRFFRHGDGQLGLFNGGKEENAKTIDKALAREGAEGRPFGFAPHSGYQRLHAGRTTLLVDTGPAPKAQVSQNAHASCLAFELSAARNRIVVNCGAAAQQGSPLHQACRTTAAHSTLTLTDQSSARFLTDSLATQLLGARITGGPGYVVSERDENDEGIWLNSSHDGYLRAFGLIHERRLYLSADGEDLRGEDSLTQPEETAQSIWEVIKNLGAQKNLPGENKTIPFALRFHLHPHVRPSLTKDGTSVLLLLPGGEGWTFRTNGRSVEIEESLYLGTGTPKASQQIVIYGGAHGQNSTRVKWAFHRLSGREG